MLAVMDYRTLNPATEELIETYPLASETEIEQALGASAGAAVRCAGRASPSAPISC